MDWLLEAVPRRVDVKSGHSMAQFPGNHPALAPKRLPTLNEGTPPVLRLRKWVASYKFVAPIEHPMDELPQIDVLRSPTRRDPCE